MHCFAQFLQTLASLRRPCKITLAVIVSLALHAAVLFSGGDAKAQTSSWTYCASEGGQCNFSGTMQVRYGDRGSYVYGTFTNGVACNNGVFGDPLVGFAKACEYSTASSTTSPPAVTPTAATSNSSWAYCASEGGQCNFSGTMQVRYGDRGSYAYGVFTNGVACSNSVFGDPLVGFGKSCEYSTDATTTPTPIATPSPVTTPTPIPISSNGTIYYVATYGNNANSCSAARDINSPKRTIAGKSGGLACLTAARGERLEIRGGTYVENITSSAQPMPSGTNWDNAAIVTSYSGETVTIAPSNGASAIAIENTQYIAFANLVIDGSNNPNTADAGIWFGTTNGSAAAHHLLFQNIEVRNWYGTNMEAFGDFSQILDSSFHDNRAYNGYGIYIIGHDNIFDGNRIYNHGGFGVHNYCNGCPNSQGPGPSRNVYRYNEIYNTGYDLIRSPAALLLHSGDGIQAYGNIIHDNAYIGIDVNATNTAVYDNTVTRNLYDIIGF